MKNFPRNDRRRLRSEALSSLTDAIVDKTTERASEKPARESRLRGDLANKPDSTEGAR